MPPYVVEIPRPVKATLSVEELSPVPSRYDVIRILVDEDHRRWAFYQHVVDAMDESIVRIWLMDRYGAPLFSKSTLRGHHD